jgi:hypothetical protein
MEQRTPDHKEQAAMGHVEMGDAFVAALNAQQWDTAANYLADDFTYSSPAFGSLGKQVFLALQKAWFAAAPDYRGTWKLSREDGDTVYGTTGMEGTQTKPLALPSLPPIPATSKRFSATFPTTVTWRADKIATINLGPSSTPTVFEQLGVQPPA